MGKTFSTAKTSIDDGVKWEEELPFEMKDIRDIAKGDFKPIRLVGFITPFMRFWIPTDAKKAYDPYKTKCKMYPSVSVDFDSDKEEFTGNDCLYRKAHYPKPEDDGSTSWQRLKPTKNYVIFFIDRERQEERDGIPLKKKFQQSQKHSDIQCATVPTAFAKAVQNVIELYAKKAKATVDPTDSEKGYDIFFKFDPEAKAEAKYTCQLGDPSPLTKAELKQVELVPETVSIFPKDSTEKILESLKRHGYVLVENGEDPAEIAAGGGRKAKSTMKANVELLDDEDEKPRKAAKAAVAEADEFEDESGDLDLDGDKEETAAPAAASTDDDDFDFEDAETPAKATKAEAAPAAEESDDDDDDFDWDDE